MAIALGYPSNHQASPKTDDERAKYLEDNVGQGKPVEALSVTTFENDGSFFGGTATYRNHYSEIHYAGATGQSYIDAAYKAAIEGYERWCSGQLRVDYHGPAKKILNWISPIELAPLTAEQSEKCELKSFTVDLPINWTLGKNYNNESVYVPSDLVYYGHCVDDNCIYYGHSSGVAAFTSFEEAQRRALIELIERDALMRNWYSRTPPNIIEIECLSIHAKKRIKYWSQKDRIIKILEIPSLYGRVVEAIIIGKEYPFFVSGAAATIDPLLTDAAVNKALQEAEYNLLLCLKYPDQSIIDPKAVITPAEHGKVYHLEENAKTLKWLWSGKTVNQFEKMEELSYSELLQKLKVITVTLSDETSKIIVVRVFSSKLVPINFGYNSAHYTHPEIKEKVCSESLLMPHYFA